MALPFMYRGASLVALGHRSARVLLMFTMGIAYYMKGAMIPAEFPIVSCMPLDVVLFPYLGLLFGSCLRGLSPKLDLSRVSGATYPS